MRRARTSFAWTLGLWLAACGGSGTSGGGLAGADAGGGVGATGGGGGAGGAATDAGGTGGPGGATPVDATRPPDAAAVDPDAGLPDPATVPLRGACPAETRIGGFKVESNDVDAYTAVDGVVKNGVPPNAVPDDAGQAGDCRLLRARRLVCEPPCGAGDTCDVGGACVPQPVGQDAGEVSVRGLVEPVTMSPIQPGNTYFYTRLPHPGFLAGQTLVLSAPSAPAGPLTLHGVGVSPIAPIDGHWHLEAGHDLTLTWLLPDEGARSRVLVEMDVDQHGLTPVRLVCDLPDTGEGTVPAAAIDALIAAGVTGFPTGRITRRTADAENTPQGCVDFLVQSVRPASLEVAGHVPCTCDEDCPAPQTCDLTIQQCHD